VCHAGICRSSVALAPKPPIIHAALHQFVWSPQGWKACEATCGISFQTRDVNCVDGGTMQVVELARCNINSKPANRKVCSMQGCPMNTLKQTCATEPSYCPTVKSQGLCDEPNFANNCCKSCP
jgi:hypothetical protein